MDSDGFGEGPQWSILKPELVASALTCEVSSRYLASLLITHVSHFRHDAAGAVREPTSAERVRDAREEDARILLLASVRPLLIGTVEGVAKGQPATAKDTLRLQRWLATSAAVERCWSGCGNCVRSDQYNMLPQTLVERSVAPCLRRIGLLRGVNPLEPVM